MYFSGSLLKITDHRSRITHDAIDSHIPYTYMNMHAFDYYTKMNLYDIKLQEVHKCDVQQSPHMVDRTHTIQPTSRQHTTFQTKGAKEFILP